jgi:hypothetical protein
MVMRIGGFAMANDTVKLPVKLKDGTVLTDALLSDLVREAETGYDPATLRPSPRHAGRPPLGAAGVSPRVQFRASSDDYARARERAREEGRSVSSVMREFLADYANGKGSGKKLS